MTMLPTMSPYSFSYVLVLFPRYHNGPNPSHQHTHLMISVDPSESFGSALCQRYTPHSRQSLLLFTDPYISKHTHTRWVHARSTKLILQFACVLLRAHCIFAASLCDLSTLTCTISISEPHILQYLVLGEVRSLLT